MRTAIAPAFNAGDVLYCFLDHSGKKREYYVRVDAVMPSQLLKGYQYWLTLIPFGVGGMETSHCSEQALIELVESDDCPSVHYTGGKQRNAYLF